MKKMYQVLRLLPKHLIYIHTYATFEVNYRVILHTTCDLELALQVVPGTSKLELAHWYRSNIIVDYLNLSPEQNHSHWKHLGALVMLVLTICIILFTFMLKTST